ncbi:MAG: hypothetical protein J6T10_04325 [Methanobrevibacter sp.]|nr:hypothetical protein [Methanobrevibacter sp.]
MELPKYKSNRRLSWDEICQDFPDVANQIVREDQWRPFEQKPDFSEVDNKLMQWVPEKVRER